MNRESLNNLIKLKNKKLYTKKVENIFNSIGSNLFIDIGDNIKLYKKNETRKEWIIWTSDNSWRITKNDRFIVGSGDDRDNIKVGIQQLLKKTVQKLFFTSDFLDLQIDFNHGYRLNTFFNWMEDNQWTIYMPDSKTLRLDFSNYDEIKSVQNTSKEFTTTQEYTSLDIKLNDSIIKNIYINKDDELEIVLKSNHIIYFTSATWRLESNNQYIIGFLDGTIESLNSIIQQLIGKEIKQIEGANSLMDARFLIGSDFILRTFACCRSVNQWKIDKKNPLFNANIDMCDL